ncbi:aldo/keto reductase [Polaromonas sp. SM01]|uniref:aldo/keto reductase n=1 Tax=Polaromonas sp. SM01 TaxID=3085630 RepID=UPI0029828422|nr:aldo/keto reductase [Polaromonas sp. SM01]MDW5443923.1 aldo/keto reductase [Polaromonas sp. SM01]
MHSRVALGTAQFGMAYGIANQLGQIDPGEAGEVLRRARTAGMDTLDTAIAYGDSEKTLGSLGVQEWKLVSKLPSLPDACTDIQGWVRAALMGSLSRLGVGKLHGLLLHRSQQLLDPRGAALYAALRDVQQEGLVDKIGVSVYGPDELDALWPKFRLDLVQSPFNVFDRRLASSGWLERMYQDGTEVHVRSVFLQGLLLQPAEKRPAEFAGWQDLWSKWDEWLAEEQLSPLQASLMFALSHPEIDRVIVGVDGASHLAEILSAPTADLIDFPNSLESSDLRLINPTQWKLQ